jgi:hypothetical protein
MGRGLCTGFCGGNGWRRRTVDDWDGSPFLYRVESYIIQIAITEMSPLAAIKSGEGDDYISCIAG